MNLNDIWQLITNFNLLWLLYLLGVVLIFIKGFPKEELITVDYYADDLWSTLAGLFWLITTSIIYFIIFFFGYSFIFWAIFDDGLHLINLVWINDLLSGDMNAFTGLIYTSTMPIVIYFIVGGFYFLLIWATFSDLIRWIKKRKNK